MKIKGFLIYILFLSILMISCGESTIYQNNKDLPEGKWGINQNIPFEIQIDDTAGRYNIAYTLRNGLDYPYYNLYLKYSLKDSLGSTISENLQELILMNKKTGKPYGSGFGDKYDHQFISLKDFEFPYQGKYYFNIIHYMRVDTLPEIYSVGLKIFQSEK